MSKTAKKSAENSAAKWSAKINPLNKIEYRRTMQDIYRQMKRMFCLALLTTLLVELMNRRSFVDLFLFIADRPWMLLYNAMIVLDILSLGMLFKRKFAVVTSLLTLIIALAFTNFMVISFRMQPFTTMDFLMIPDGLDIMPVYFNIFEMALIFGGIGMVIAGVVFLFLKSPKKDRPHFWAKLATVAAFTACLLGINFLAVKGGVIERRMDNLVSAYQDYGFTYCFTRTFANMGISRPSAYSGEVVEEIVTGLEEETAASHTASKRPTEELPNIVYLQLESFFDVPGQLTEAKLSQNPIPNFTKLMEAWPSGAFLVPSVGGGTANTEFEVLTGMNLDYFGAGEYPYNTVLNNTTCETVCYNLAAHDYTSTAIHNYLGTFYGRNTIYSQLGFDVFVPLEYMNGLTYNRQGWAHDTVLVDEVMDALESSPTRDFIMTISVQSHGKYPTTLPEGGNPIDVISCPETVDPIQLENFVNELHSVDEFIAELLAALEAHDEPTVVVMYGDHLPALGTTPDDMACESIYQTNYIIWNNYGAEFEAPDLQAYRLTANILKQLGIDTGIITRFHQAADIDDVSDEYLDALEILEYDMLYGERESTGGVVPYQATDLRLGTDPIVIANASFDEETGKLVVGGRNFTPSSVILLDGKRLETAFITTEVLVAVPDRFEGEMEIHVAQVTKENIELGRTRPFKIAATLPEEN